MSEYSRPTYAALKARIEADLAAMPAVLRAPLAAAWARACHSQHGYLEWIDAQCSPLSCEEERLYDWAGLYGVERLPAVAASGTLLATGTAGTQVLADALLRSASTGLDYAVVEAVELGAGETPVLVRCVTPGAAGNISAGTLTLVEPVPGCNSSMTVSAAGLTGGEDIEALADWRLRVAEEWQVVVTEGTRSGKPDDYRAWARSAHPSVTGALVYPNQLGLGTVLVRPICNGLTDRLPTSAVLDAVAARFQVVAPATADWRVVAPLVHAVDFEIHLLPGYDSASNRAAVIAALQALIKRESSETSVLTLAEIDAAIATITTQYVRVAPDESVSVLAGGVLVFGGVAWS